MSEEIKKAAVIPAKNLKLINLITIIGCAGYFGLIFLLPNQIIIPSQIGVVILIAIIAYRTYKKPDFWWTLIAIVWLLAMYASLLFN